jgi:hypothetical protein
MAEPLWTRAAVLHVNERGTGAAFEGSFHLTADGSHVQLAMVKVLPVGRRIGEYGRSMLDRGTDGVRQADLPGAQRVKFTTTNWIAELLWMARKERIDGREEIPPLDLPVWVDPTDGRVIEVHTDTLEEELRPMRDEGVWLWKRTSSLMSDVRAAAGAPGGLVRLGTSTLREWKKELGGVVADLKSRRPAGDRPAGTVEGVDYETWIQVKALLARDGEVHPRHVDLFTHFRGIPWGRWAAIDASWSAHAPKEWVDYDFIRFKPTGASWEAGY